MGEYADYILNGDDCQECGEHMGEGDGFPRTCTGCLGSRGDDLTPTPDAKPYRQARGKVVYTPKGSTPQLGKKLRGAIKSCHGVSGMYPGTYWDHAPASFARLEKMGFVEQYHPHNPVHKTRAILTDKGAQAYADIKAGKAVLIHG